MEKKSGYSFVLKDVTPKGGDMIEIICELISRHKNLVCEVAAAVVGTLLYLVFFH